MDSKKRPKTEQYIRELMPAATEAEIEEAIENFQEYLTVVLGIANRVEEEGKEISKIV